MDQEAVGKFIAECRREKGLTQFQLAERLGLTNRAVSKWETGKCCPDASLMLELCGILGITVNELLSGEKICMENYQQKAEENLMDLQAKKEKAKKELTVFKRVWGAAAVLLFPAHLAINYFYPNNTGTGIGEVLVILGFILGVFYFFRNYEIKLKS